jgi:hypothetical protein
LELIRVAPRRRFFTSLMNVKVLRVGSSRNRTHESTSGRSIVAIVRASSAID